ncbi:MAG: hypothetical protein CMJ72_04570, partial [Planctomycetaceae bacterium]|nr:hypothetical protein [Planctomycetaceae bacterium]
MKFQMAKKQRAGGRYRGRNNNNNNQGNYGRSNRSGGGRGGRRRNSGQNNSRGEPDYSDNGDPL